MLYIVLLLYILYFCETKRWINNCTTPYARERSDEKSTQIISINLGTPKKTKPKKTWCFVSRTKTHNRGEFMFSTLGTLIARSRTVAPRKSSRPPVAARMQDMTKVCRLGTDFGTCHRSLQYIFAVSSREFPSNFGTPTAPRFQRVTFVDAPVIADPSPPVTPVTKFNWQSRSSKVPLRDGIELPATLPRRAARRFLKLSDCLPATLNNPAPPSRNPYNFNVRDEAKGNWEANIRDDSRRCAGLQIYTVTGFLCETKLDSALLPRLTILRGNSRLGWRLLLYGVEIWYN